MSAWHFATPHYHFTKPVNIIWNVGDIGVISNVRIAVVPDIDFDFQNLKKQ